MRILRKAQHERLCGVTAIYFEWETPLPSSYAKQAGLGDNGPMAQQPGR